MGKGNMLLARPVVRFGTAGSPASTPWMFLRDEDTVKRTITPVGQFDVRDASKRLLAARGAMGETIKYEFNSPEITPDIVARALAKTKSGNVVEIGNPTEALFYPTFSFALLAYKADGSTYYERVPYAMVAGGLETTFGGGPSVAPLVIEACDPEENTGNLYPQIIDGDETNVEKTLSSGTFARVADYHVVKGEGGVADALTDVTGADLVDGELLTLQVYSAAQPITLTHAAGTLELQGSANWVMTSTNDMIVLRYDLANTKWVERERYMAAR